MGGGYSGDRVCVKGAAVMEGGGGYSGDGVCVKGAVVMEGGWRVQW